MAEKKSAHGPGQPMSGKTLSIVFAVLAGLFWVIGAYAPAAFLGHFTVFVLACFIGYMVVWNVTPALHTPLMSVTNAISSIIAIGALVQIAPPEMGTAGRPDGLIAWLAFAALVLTAINMFGGFAVTRRMLAMFRKEEEQQEGNNIEMSQSLATVAYLGAAILFILSLGGLSNPETSRRGNLLGMVGMALAVLATVFGPRVCPSGLAWIVGALAIGGGIGLYAARVVKMTQMPELVALMHSLVGLAACLVGFASYVDTAILLEGVEKTIHEVEIYIGILIGAITFSGSLIAFGKLNGKIGGNPPPLPARHWLNLVALLVVIYFGREFLNAPDVQAGMVPLIVMAVIALLFGIHMVMAIGGADMPVVVSMLNSYSGWAAAATGFMLSNDLLIVTGALVGSSGAILSYIMCNAMNRNFISVIAGGLWRRCADKKESRCGRSRPSRKARWCPSAPPIPPNCCAKPSASSSSPATAWPWRRHSTP